MLHHYRTTREYKRLLPFWSNRGLCQQSEANMVEIMSRADTLIDGIEMLCPQNTESQRRCVREAVIWVAKSAMLVHGTFVIDEAKPHGVIPIEQEKQP
jgi:hypothetical protein